MRPFIHVMSAWVRDRPRTAWVLPLMVTIALTGLTMTAFEFLKDVLFPHIDRNVSHMATIVFTTVLASGVTFVAMRIYYELLQKTLDEMSERLRLNEELLQERGLMHALMEHTLDMIYFKDRYGKFLRVNKPFAQRLGIQRPADLAGKSDFDIFTLEHASEAYGDEQRVIRTGEPMVGKIERETWPDGHETWVSSTKIPLRDKRGRIIGTFGISRDITESQKVEERLRHLSRAIDQSPTVVMITNLEAVIEYVNPRFTKVTGYESSEVLGRKPDLLKSGRTPSGVYKELWERILAGEEWNGELLNRKKNGDFYWGRTVISPIRNAQGVITHYVSLMQDITDQKNAEQQHLIELERRKELEAIINRSTVVVFLWRNEAGWPVDFVSDSVR